MRNQQNKALKDVIKEFLKVYRLNDKLSEVKLISSWEKIMGKTVSKYTSEVFIKNKTLFIRLTNAALRNELSYNKEKIITLLNEEVGEKVIDDVTFV